ncbi:MAG: hypothetical protein WC940_03015 [Candidatus Paceibacterota bacterium]|jgi:DNA-directed RNA polymerase subunit RPC12/RpoP
MSGRCECKERKLPVRKRNWTATVRKFYHTNQSRFRLTMDVTCKTCGAKFVLKGREQELYWELGGINPEKDFHRAGEILDFNEII